MIANHCKLDNFISRKIDFMAKKDLRNVTFRWMFKFVPDVTKQTATFWHFIKSFWLSERTGYSLQYKCQSLVGSRWFLKKNAGLRVAQPNQPCLYSMPAY